MQRSMELTMEKTLEHLQAIANFLNCYKALWSAHVVQFFHDRLWEEVDVEWWSDLEHASLQDLLWLPSGKVHESWCASLKNFVKTAQSLALARQPGEDIEKIFPGLRKPKISNPLRQGMNAKKLHEVELLAGVVNKLFRATQATHVVDVGAGQGYLSQVLSFEYGVPVVALDACAHHADVTNQRSERLKKHYKACSKKANQTSMLQGTDCFNVSGPQTATFHVNPRSSQTELQYFLSTLALENMSDLAMESFHTRCDQDPFGHALKPGFDHKSTAVDLTTSSKSSFVLAGLHACGDLSATMLKTYMACHEVKAIVTVGCCYNLLSESCSGVSCTENFFGFPLSEGVKKLGITLGRRACDLACQSAERWRDVGTESALYNFAQHSLRAGFQLVLQRYHPELAKNNPTVGRLGKARRRKQVKKNILQATSMHGSHESRQQFKKDTVVQTDIIVDNVIECSKTKFAEFATSACQRLGLECLAEEQLEAVWQDIEAKTPMVGPYWSLRAVLGPVLETFILLDRLLYLQEQSHLELSCSKTVVGLEQPRLIPLFNPTVSPRNMAIMAIKSFELK